MFLAALGVFVMAVTLWRLVRIPVLWAAVRNPKGLWGVPAEPPAVEPAGRTTTSEDDDLRVPVDGTTTATEPAPSTVTRPTPVDAPATPAALASTAVNAGRPSSSSTTTTKAAAIPTPEQAAATTTTRSAARATTAGSKTATTTRSAARATTAGPKTAATRPKTATTRPKTTATRSRKAATSGAPAAACTASVDNRTPAAGESVVVTVTSNVPATPFTVTAHYKSKDRPLSGVTNSAGAGSVTFDVGSATKGYTVKVDVNISGKATCSTEFTPQ
jgi:hypothetical protein